MKKYILTLVIIASGVQSLMAQFKISGIVKDLHSNELLKGASISIHDLNLNIHTNSEGEYVFKNLKKGYYLIEASYQGFKPTVEQVYVNKDTILYFELAASHKEISEIVITGVSRSSQIKHNPVIIKSIDKNFLNQNTATNLIDALKNVPGINQITTGASISKPVIRGMGYNRVISLLNGIKQEGQQWGDEHGIEIDEYAVDKIELIKGPGSLMYGSDGIAGVLNFISPKSPPSGESRMQFISNYQSNNNLLGFSLSNSGNMKDLQWLGRLTYKKAGNFQNIYEHKVLNSGFKELNGNLSLSFQKKWGYSQLHFNTFNTTINLPEGDRDSLGNFVYENANGEIITANENELNSLETGFPHQVVNHLRLSSNSYFLLKKGTIHLDLGFQNNKRKEYANIADPNEIELFFDLNTFSYNSRYNLERMKGWETSIGVSGMFQNHINRGIEYLIPNYNLFDAGTFIYTQKTFDKKWTLAGGLRLDNRSINVNKLNLDSDGLATDKEDSTVESKFKAFDQSFLGLSGSLGVSYQTSKSSTIKFNLSRGFRAPNIVELSSNGRHEGTFRYEIGNINLKPELSHQIDLAYFLNSEHIELELSPFVNFVSNYIYANKLTDSTGNDIIFDPADPAPAFGFTQGNATLLGGEIYLDIHPHPFDWLHIANSFSYVQAYQSNATDSSKYLPFIPAPKYRAELKAEFKKLGTSFSNLYFKVGLDHFFPQDLVFSAYGTESATPGYTLLSAGIGTNVKAFNKKDALQLFFTAENLTNLGFQNHLSRLKYGPENLATGRSGIFNPGRNFSLKMIANF